MERTKVSTAGMLPPPYICKCLSGIVCAFASAFILILAACETPTDPAPEAQAIVITDVKSLPFSVQAGDDTITIVIDDADAGTFIEVEDPDQFPLSHFELSLPQGNRGYRTLSGATVSRKSAVQVTITGLPQATTATSGAEQTITIRAAAQVTQIAKVTATSIPAASVQEANKFKSDHATILGKTTVTADDLEALTAALAAYEALNDNAKILLTSQKALLDALKFKIDHAAILAKTTSNITTGDLTAVNAALTDYEVLSSAVKALLSSEKALLDSLKVSLLALQFKTTYAAILAKTTSNITTGDLTAVNAALTAYEALDPAVKALLTVEKAKLDSLKANLLALQFKTTHAAILAKTPSDIATGDLADVNAALTAYEALDPAAKALLTAEKAKLDALKFKLTHAAIIGKTTVKPEATGGIVEIINEMLAREAARTAYNALSDAAKAHLSAQEKAFLDALNFYMTHSAILGKDTLTSNDLVALNAALTAYNALSDAAKAYLTEQKATLDSLNSLRGAVIKVSFPGVSPYTDITLSGLNGKNIYMVQMNTSGEWKILAAGTGYATTLSSSGEIPLDAVKNSDSFSGSLHRSASQTDTHTTYSGKQVSGIFVADDGTQIERQEAPYLHKFAKNPLPPPDTATVRNMQRGRLNESRILRSASQGDTKTFWVEGTSGWQEIPVTLRACNDACDVWVADANYDNGSSSKTDNKITSAQATAMATKFESLYGLVTPVFGIEKGGGSSGDGGVDGEKRVQILVYDIYYDYTPGQSRGVFGFFNPDDEYAQSTLDSFYGADKYKTNNAEMLYIDAHFTDIAESGIHSTLVHEFQHLINFEQKTTNSEVWFNEMMSMLAEDLISPMIGIPVTDSGHPILSRMPRSLGRHWAFPTYGFWDYTEDAVYDAYSNAYAFGAYLVRNYGGPALVKEFAKSGSSNNAEAINAALNSSVNPLKATVNTIEKAFNRYGEAFIYGGSGTPNYVMTFDKTVSSTIGSTLYTYSAFNIWDITNSSNYNKGPYITSATSVSRSDIRAHSFRVQKLSDWSNVTGNRTIRVYKPSESAYIDVYLMVR